MNPKVIEVVTTTLKQARDAGHGQRQKLYSQACETLGVSMSTFHRYKKALSVPSKDRKQRSDAGKTELTRDEATLISGALLEAMRANDKAMYSLGHVVQALRDNGLIIAGRINTDTGEIIPLSDSAIHRALRNYKLHPEQLMTPSAHIEMKSLHPNHVWQIDASLCVLYYLKPTANGANGLHCMARDEFYKNKPKNLKRIMADRVWSYEITDHTSGWIYVEYVMGAESGENLCSVLINAMQERGNADVMHGVPKILYMDPGSANTSAMTQSLCNQLGIEAIAHKAGNARATGQVENARNIIECNFESGLRFRPVADLEELNKLARTWRIIYNNRQVHSRHKMTRTACWLKITEEQLVKAPSVEQCRELAVSTPVERVVTTKLRVRFDGEEFDVSHVPNVIVGEKLMVTRNTWRTEAAQVVMTGEDGHITHYVAPLVTKDDYGFAHSAQTFGEGFTQQAQTVADKARTEIEKVMTGTETTNEAEKARKNKTLPLGGKFDPYISLDESKLPEYLPRRGKAHELDLPTVEVPPLNLTQAAMRLRNRMQDQWKPEFFQWLQQRYPDGVPEGDIDGIANKLINNKTTTLKVVGGQEK